MKQSLSRGRFAASATATLASINIVRAPAKAAQFAYKYGNDQSLGSPVTVRAVQMWKAIERETGGKLSVQTFPDSTLGGDTQMIAQLRSGALQFLTEPGAILGNVVPAAQITDVAYAFHDQKQAFAAADGELGEFVRKEIAAKGMYAIPHPFDNGFREITANKPVRTAGDLDGLKIRVPASPAFVDLFKTLGASPTPLNVSELYTSLQTHIVEAQENALINIEQSKIFEVQKTLNFSNHAWSCWWFLANKDAWDALGSDVQAVVTRNVAKYAAFQRRDFAALTASLTDKLRRQGLDVYQCDTASFKARLGPYYAKWKATYGPTAWDILEKYAGKLA
jgi:tripartite ATP-independent transporter DctP family solute receptor